jgi:acyl carrier protein
MSPQALTFDDFCGRLAAALEIPRSALDADVSFLESLAFDSLRMLTLAMLFEDLDVDMPAELAWDIRTVGDAYAYYTEQVAAAAPAPR